MCHHPTVPRLLIALLAGLVAPAAVQAQEGDVEAEAPTALTVELVAEFDEQLVVVGSRSRPRSVTESSVPIDAIPVEDVVSQGASSLDYLLRNLVPSFNVATHPISGAASLVRPASLRNLAHDHTLVLVNGKRRHRSAILVWFGGVTDGTQGPDISTIPATALRQVEVLRDGASAPTARATARRTRSPATSDCRWGRTGSPI